MAVSTGQGLFPFHLSAPGKHWAGQSEAELLFWILRRPKELIIPHLFHPHTVLSEILQLPNYRWKTEAQGDRKPCSQKYTGTSFPMISMEIGYFGAFRDPDLGILPTVTQDGTEVRSSK